MPDTMIQKSFPVEIQKSADGQFTVVVSTDGVDRDKDIIESSMIFVTVGTFKIDELFQATQFVASRGQQ